MASELALVGVFIIAVAILGVGAVADNVFVKIICFGWGSLILFGTFANLAHAQSVGEYQHTEMRYCGEPRRGKLGEILRDKTVVAAFKRVHPCPSTGKTSGACDGWAIDHVIPMACGGCDAVSNMQWLPDSMKNHAGITPKDRWERQIYAYDNLDGSPKCKFKIQR